MDQPRLKAGVWVSALLRRCDLDCLSAMVRRRGDADAGAVILKVDRREAGIEVLTQIQDGSGALAWLRPLGAACADDVAEAYLARQSDFDPDVWVVEIEDPKGRFQPDGKILA